MKEEVTMMIKMKNNQIGQSQSITKKRSKSFQAPKSDISKIKTVQTETPSSNQQPTKTEKALEEEETVR